MNTSLIKLCALLFILPVFIACRQKKALPAAAKTAPVADSITYRDVFSRNPSRYYFDYDSTKDDMYNLNSGYVDTFSIAGTRFRFRFNRDTADDDYLEMQVYKNDRWTTNFRTFYAPNGYDESEDVNDDGFNDFQQFFSSRFFRIYLYNPSEKKFVDTFFIVSEAFRPVDKRTNTYYDVQDGIELSWISPLYQFKGVQKHCLFSLHYLCSGLTPDSSARFLLYKCLHDDPDDTVFVKRIKAVPDDADFDVEKFWRGFVHTRQFHE